MDKIVAGIAHIVGIAHLYNNSDKIQQFQSNKAVTESIENNKKDDELSIYMNTHSSNKGRFEIHPIVKRMALGASSSIFDIGNSQSDVTVNAYTVENVGKCDAKDFTKTIKALNYGTPYSFSFVPTSIHPVYNLYIKKDFLAYAFPKDIPSDLFSDYLINLKWIAFGVIAKLYSSLYFNNMRTLESIAINLAVAIARSLECAVTPQIVADAFEIDLDAAEMIIDSFDANEKKFDNKNCLSWFIRF